MLARFFNRRVMTNFDWIGFFLILAIAGIGLLTLWSVTHQDPFHQHLFIKQVYGTLAGIALYIMVSFIDPHKLERIGYVAYLLLFILLALTLMRGSIGMGGQRWYSIGGIKFQPSECAKILFPPFLTFFLSTESSRPFSYQTFGILLFLLLCSSLLILKQPDLGTAIIILGSGLILFAAAGLNPKVLITFGIIIAIASPIAWKALRPYQQNRILVFIGEGNAHKESYQIEQSTISIGSGKLFGKGIGQGTQNRYAFLPARHTDFIFSIYAEEFGFFGCLVLLLLYLGLFIHIFRRILLQQNPFERLLALGLITPFILSAFINISMVLRLAPVVGIPLPLMGYGLTNLLITYASLGWINSLHIHRFAQTPLPRHLDQVYNEHRTHIQKPYS